MSVTASNAPQNFEVEEISIDPAIPLNHEQWITVFGTGGTYRLAYGDELTAPIAPTASAADIAAALSDLPGIAALGEDGTPPIVTGSGGPGGILGGFHYRVTFDGVAADHLVGRIQATDVLLTGFSPKVLTRCVSCADLYQPTGAPPPSGWPAVVLLHPGGFTGGQKDTRSEGDYGDRMESWAFHLASAGFVVLAVNYRLADPATLPFGSCPWDGSGGPVCGPWGEALELARLDVHGAARWLRWADAEGVVDVDVDRIAAVGESAGAMAALAALYRADDPGAVGVVGPDSSLNAVVALAGFTVESWFDPGAGPAMLLVSTNDPLAELWGLDMFTKASDLVRTARADGGSVDLVGSCSWIDQTGDGVEDPVHLAPLDSQLFSEWTHLTVAFLEESFDTTSPGTPSGWQWESRDRTQPFVPRSAQTLVGPQQPIVGDFDGDGVEDILWYGEAGACDTAWFGRGDGTFDDPRNFDGAQVVRPVDIPGDLDWFVGDFDGDGVDDIAWIDRTDGTVGALWWGSPDRTFEVQPFTGFPTGVAATVGDFDGDGSTDVLLRALAAPLAVVVYSGGRVGDPGIGPLLVTPPGAEVVVVDLDGDGIDDVVWLADDGLSVTYGEADRSAAVSPLEVSATFEVAHAGDFDGDGFGDLLLHTPYGANQILYGSPARGEVALSGAFGLNARVTDVGEIDGDGRSDVVLEHADGSVMAAFGTVSRRFFPIVPSFSRYERRGSVDPALVAWEVESGEHGRRSHLLWQPTVPAGGPDQ